ncbi:GGDEF domain-containing protein, partial [Bacillus cereus]|nr:GGDEF domain-containing protein [Bacillus cereus]
MFLAAVLSCYVSFYLLLLFAFHFNHFFTDFNIRISSLIIETIVFASLLYSLLSRKISKDVFWICITIAIGCFLLGNFISAFQILNIEIPIENFHVSDVFLLFFLFLLLVAFFYKIIKECNKWEKAYLLCDISIVITSIFTLEWYIFNNPAFDN